MPQPSISVVIPVYNCEPFIGQALDSIYAQICRPDQVIVVDDGSTDRTANVVESYRFTEDRLQPYLSFVGKIFPNAVASDYRPDTKPVELVFLRQENLGPSAARNLGMQHSRGEWISFLDADDVWLPATVCTLLELIRNYPQAAIVFGDGLNFTEGGKVLQRLSEDLGGFPKGIIDEAFEYMSEKNAIVNAGAILARRRSILKVGGFREAVVPVEDHDLWLRLALFTQLACTDNVVLLRRRRRGALSENQEAFYRAEPRIFSHLKKSYNEVLIQHGIDIEKHSIRARYRLTYFYYAHKMPLKAILAAVRLAWAYLGYLPRRRKVSSACEKAQ
jgi:glycosyltransferase involved in cell wall biosynthesis